MVSIKEVAKHAGVAISTVSKVLNGYPNIAQSTKDKVNASIKELGYVPNSIASALSSKQYNKVALIMDPSRNTQAIDQIFMQYLLGALEASKEMNVEVQIILNDTLTNMSCDEIIIYLRSLGISGIIIYSMSKDDTHLHELIKSQTFAAVVIDAPFVNEKTSLVSVDHKQAQLDVAKQTILDDKCKSVLYISGKKDSFVSEQRLDGIKQLCKELKLKLCIKDGEFSEALARSITLKYGKKYDCVVCSSDLMAIGAMNALIDLDIFRPVCGFDGITLMGYVGKQMNTIDQDFYHLSSRAVYEVLQIMKGASGRRVIMPHRVVKLYYDDIIR